MLERGGASVKRPALAYMLRHSGERPFKCIFDECESELLLLQRSVVSIASVTQAKGRSFARLTSKRRLVIDRVQQFISLFDRLALTFKRRLLTQL